MIPAEAIEALASVLAQEALIEADMAGAGWDAQNDSPEPFMSRARERARAYLEAAAPYMAMDRKSLAKVLAGHQIHTGNRGMTPRCTCGWLGQVFGNDFREDFITHQADMLTVALSRAE